MLLISSIWSIQQIALQEYLSQKEINDYDQVPLFKKNDWLIGKFCLKQVIYSYFLKNLSINLDLSKIKIIKKRFQKPTYQIPIKNNYQTNISLSHCDSLAIGAIADNQKDGLIGLDIERVRNFKPNTLKSFLTAKEFSKLKKQPLTDQPKLATLFWSIKEAYLKALGYGLTYHPQFIEIEMDSKKLYDQGRIIPIMHIRI